MSAAAELTFNRGDLVLIRALVIDGVAVACSGPWLSLVDHLEAIGEVVAVRPLSDLSEIRWMPFNRLELVQRAG